MNTEQTAKTPQNGDFKKITLNEFAELVKQMRHNQRRYFAQRKPEILETCKKLVAEVDEIISRLTDTQLKLF